VREDEDMSDITRERDARAAVALREQLSGCTVLTVAELIERLQAMPQDAPVLHEGCDCYGAADGVAFERDGAVVITRSEEIGRAVGG
jgi:hypothetical protein